MQGNTYIWFDGELVDSEQAKVSVRSHSLHYGTAVFEAIRAYAKEHKLAVLRAI